MDKKRLTFITILFFALFSLMTARIYFLSQKEEYRSVVNVQSLEKISLYNNRGFIYDCNFSPLVNNNDEYVYLIDPYSVSLSDLKKSMLPIDEKITSKHYYYNTPFLIKSPLKYNCTENIFSSKTFSRYSVSPYASHLIGYTKENKGISGLEKVFDNFLNEHTNSLSVEYEKNAYGGRKINSKDFKCSQKSDLFGVVTTIDKKIQKIVEDSFSKYFDKGAVVVSETETGQIKAMASFPTFDPNKIENYINNKDSPLLNRVLSGYDFGSIFKIIVTASALENKISPDFSYYCDGYYKCEEKNIECFKKEGHHLISMQKAFEQSCNPYFIALGKELGGKKLLETAKKFKLGEYTELFKGYCDNGGNLPDLSEIKDEISLANFSIGQGTLSVTPIQATAVVNVIASGGYYIAPRLIRGISDEKGEYLEKTEIPISQTRIISEETALTIQNFMENVVSKGSGINAKSGLFSSAGKTGSAETGWQSKNDNKNEMMVQGWFSGFFPSNSEQSNNENYKKPKYCMTILCENGKSGASAAAPIFKIISEEIVKQGL